MDALQEAKDLFQKYRDALNGEFLTFDDAQAADNMAKIFLEKLDELGFMVASHFQTSTSYERVQNGEAITLLTFFFSLSLVPKGTPLIKNEVDAKRVDSAEAVAKIYGSPTVPPPRKGEWNFTEKERHAFLCALERNGEKLAQYCQKSKVPINPEGWKIIFAGVGVMTTDPDDTIILNYLLEEEIPFLEKYGRANELAGCPCQAGEHIDALNAWKHRNIEAR